MTPPELIPNSVPLFAVPGLTGAQIELLRKSWIVTAQELVRLHGTNDRIRDLLAQALGIARPALAGIVQDAQALIPETRSVRSVQLEMQAAQARYGLGALLDEPPEVMEERLRLPEYAPAARAVLPPGYSLLDQLPPVRDQGSRGTCVAHAVLSVREALELGAGSPAELNLSEQYVYWWCKGHDGIPKASGTYVAVGMRCLNETGAPLEEAWPYVHFETDDQGQGPPPAPAASGDQAFRTLQTQEFNRNDIPGIKTCLAEGRAVAFSIPVFDSWYFSSATSRWGKITLPLPGEKENGGHAMALVGYQDDPAAPGGGYFLVRNSWRPWAYDGVWREGYGYIPYEYIRRHATAVFSARRVTGTGLHLRDSIEQPQPHTGARLTWNSPDLWVRRSADGGTEPQAPLAGQPNAVYVRAHNRGPCYAYDVRCDLFYAPVAAYVRPADWQRLGRVRALWLKPGETVLGPCTWTPPTAGPFAILARLASAEDTEAGELDPIASARVAQRNLWQVSAPRGGTVEVAFDLVAAAGKGGAVSLLVNRGNLPANVVVSPIQIGPARSAPVGDTGGRERGIVDDAVTGALTGGVLLGIGQRRRASLQIALPPDAPTGASYRLEVAQLQGAETVGRLHVWVQVAA